MHMTADESARTRGRQEGLGVPLIQSVCLIVEHRIHDYTEKESSLRYRNLEYTENFVIYSKQYVQLRNARGAGR